MHQLIYALVEAPNRDDALASGNAAFDRLVGVGPDTAAVFDYYVTFDDETTFVAGKARWGELPVVAPVDSDEGSELLERGWSATTEEFERNLERVRAAVDEFSTEELMRDKELARHACYNLGAYRGPSLFIYDGYGGRFAIATNSIASSSPTSRCGLFRRTSTTEPEIARQNRHDSLNQQSATFAISVG